MVSFLLIPFVALSCLVLEVCSLELRLYPSDFKHFSQAELRWPKDNSLHLTCELEGKDKDLYTLVWYLPHSQSRSTNITLQNGKSTLWMDGITSDDNGPYKCKAEKKIGLKIENVPRVKDKILTLYVASTEDSAGCQTGFFQCASKKHHCIGKRYLCDGYSDCPDGSDETALQCGEEDWCDGKLRCGDEARCLDPALCCDPQRDPSCERLLECCEPYINANRFFFQLGVDSVENSKKSQNTKREHIVVMIGGIIAFTCVLLVVIILMCQFPTEKPWLRPPNFLSRGRWPRNHPPPHSLPVTMEDLDVYFESLRNVSRSDEPIALPLPPMPPPYILASEPPPPYPDSPRSIREPEPIQEIFENNNEDNNNGDINGNSDMRDQMTERVVAVLRPISPAIASRRLLRGGRSLVTLNPGQQGHPTHQQPTMRESRSYAALVSPTHLQRIMLRDSSSSDSD